MTESFTSNVIAEAIDYLVAHAEEQPSLEAVSERAGYEPTYFQKIFTQHVGISPKKMLQYMTARQARELLLQGHTVQDVACDTGLSSSSRLHDLFVRIEGATPGQVQRRGQGIVISYGYHPTILGEVMVAQTPLGVCWLGFVMGDDREWPLYRLQKHWPAATLVKDQDITRPHLEKLLGIWTGRAANDDEPLKLDLYGTPFQIQVWKALLQIPYGHTRTYRDIAVSLGRPSSSRAVGNAVGANPISVLIPCHRVIRATGIIDNYAWGSPRKKLILGLEGRGE